MAPVDVTGKVNPREVQRLALQGKPTSDFSSTPTTWTVTFVVTPSTSLELETITVDYSST